MPFRAGCGGKPLNAILYWFPTRSVRSEPKACIPAASIGPVMAYLAANPALHLQRIDVPINVARLDSRNLLMSLPGGCPRRGIYFMAVV
jgi:hypothetical protein